MNITFRAMTIDDYRVVASLWKETEGVGLTEADSESGIDSFLQRNPGMSVVAVNDCGIILGTLLCGHDGRRGYLHHLAVVPPYRAKGIASALIEWSFECLGAEGIEKCNVFLLSSNEAGAAFWAHNGWLRRQDLQVFQKMVRSGEG